MEGRTLAEAFGSERGSAFAAELAAVLAGETLDTEWTTIDNDLLLIHAAPVVDGLLGIVGVMLIGRFAESQAGGSALRESVRAPSAAPLGRL